MYLASTLTHNFVWDAIQAVLPAKTKKSPTNFVNLNCPMCVERGESIDKRRRCGVKYDSRGVGISCFNCGLRILWSPSMLIGRELRLFLLGLGVTEDEVKRLAYKAAQIKRFLNDGEVIDREPDAKPLFEPDYPAIQLPDDARPFGYWRSQSNAEFEAVTAYVAARGTAIDQATEYYWSSSSLNHLNQRVIIPMMWNDKIVGWSGRGINDEVKPKYLSHAPPNFVFNNRFLRGQRKFVIVVEGIFDALAIEGVGIMSAAMNDQQAYWIQSSDMIPILVPDRDKAGQRLVTTAMMLGWHVSFPKWDEDIKDVADAVKRYGKLFALRAILESATARETQIQVEQKLYIRT